MKNISKIIAIVVAVFIAAYSLPIIVDAVDIDITPDYTGKIFVAVNTDINETDGSGTFTLNKVSSVAPNTPQNQTLEEENNLTDDYGDTTPADAQLPQVPTNELLAEMADNQTAPTSYKVNDTRSINSDGNITINLTCLYIGNNCTVWGQNDCDNKIKLSSDQAKEIGQRFDQTKADCDSVFGSFHNDVDGDGKIAILCYDLYDEWSKFGAKGSNFKGSYTLGYFWSADMGSRNNIDCINIDTYPSMGYTTSGIQNVKAIYSTLFHEYQHLVNYSGSMKLPSAGTKNTMMETFMNEGFSMGAEHVLFGSAEVENRITGNCGFNAVVESEKGRSLTHWYSNNSVNNYGPAYVFGQYIRTRYAQLTGDTGKNAGKGIYKAIIDYRVKNDETSAFKAAAEILYPSAKYPELTTNKARCDRLIRDFWIAVYVKESTGEYGFNGESFAQLIDVGKAIINNLPATGIASLPVHNGGALYYRIDGDKGGTVSVDTGKSSKSLSYAALEEAQTLNYDFVLVLDYSGSMSNKQIASLKTASKLFCDQVFAEDGVNVGIIRYASSIYTVSDLSNDKSAVINAIDKMPSYGSGTTNILGAISKAGKMLESSTADKQIILLMTDGEPNVGSTADNGIRYSSYEEAVVANSLYWINKMESEGKNLDIYTLGFFIRTNTRAEKLLSDIANLSNNDGTYLKVDDVNELIFEYGQYGGINKQKHSRMLMTFNCPIEVSITPSIPNDVENGRNGELITHTHGMPSLDSSSLPNSGSIEESYGKMEVKRKGTNNNEIIVSLDTCYRYFIEIEGLSGGVMETSVVTDGATRYFSKVNIDSSDTKGYMDTKLIDNDITDYVILEMDYDGDGDIDDAFEPVNTNKKYTITATAESGGSITPSGATKVNENESVTYNIVPNDGYEIKTVYVDGNDVGAIDTYTFSNIKADATIRVIFINTKSTSVSGSIKSYDDDTSLVTVELLSGDNVVASTKVKGNSASYELTGIENGKYMLRVSKAKHAARDYSVVVDNNNVIVDATICLIGDVNVDGRVNSTDALWVRQSSAGSRSLDEYQRKVADVNGDNRVNSTDALWIRQISAGSRTLG